MEELSIDQQKALALASARMRASEAQDTSKQPSLSASPKSSASDLLPDTIGSIVNTVTEPVVSMATGTIGSALGGIAGLGAAAIPGLRPGIGRDVSGAVSNALTYEPRSTGGKAVMGAIQAPFQALAGGADKAGQAAADYTGSPAVGAGVNTAIQALPLAAGPLMKRAGLGQPEPAAILADRAKAQSLGSVKDATLAAGRAEGLVVPPSAVDGGTWPGNRLESTAGKAALTQAADLKNQPIFNKIARREANVPEGDPLTALTLEKARTQLAAPYREVEALPGLQATTITGRLLPRGSANPSMVNTPKSPAELVHDWKSNNSRITDLWKDYQRNGRVETLDAYRAARKTQDGIETGIENAAVAAGRADLVPALKAARVELAKNYTVERALNLGNGDIDAAVLGRMMDHGSPLSGGLKTIADFQQAFPSASREAAKVGTPGVSKLEAVGAVFFGGGGAAAFGPMGIAAAAIPIIAPPLARSYLLSKSVQQPRNYGPGALANLGASPGFANMASAIPPGVLSSLQQNK